MVTLCLQEIHLLTAWLMALHTLCLDVGLHCLSYRGQYVTPHGWSGEIHCSTFQVKKSRSRNNWSCSRHYRKQNSRCCICWLICPLLLLLLLIHEMSVIYENTALRDLPGSVFIQLLLSANYLFCRYEKKEKSWNWTMFLLIIKWKIMEGFRLWQVFMVSQSI